MESLKGESLIKLLDDPDPLVYEAVIQKIQQIGTDLLPDLELAAKQAMSPILFERIEMVIKALRFDQLKHDLSSWINSSSPKLIEGAWLAARFQFVELGLDQFTAIFKPLRDKIWLEISESLTALEKIRVMNTLYFEDDRIILNEAHPDSPGNNFINRVIETGKANEHSISLLYAIIAQELGMPLFVADMPGYPILAYMDMPMVENEVNDPGLYDVLFYVNATDYGSVHSRDDLTNYLIKQSLPLQRIFYQPRSNPEFIRLCLNKMALDYDLSGSQKRSLQVLELIKLWK